MVITKTPYFYGVAMITIMAATLPAFGSDGVKLYVPMSMTEHNRKGQGSSYAFCE